MNATVGFFKTGSPITVAIQGPTPTGSTDTGAVLTAVYTNGNHTLKVRATDSTNSGLRNAPTLSAYVTSTNTLIWTLSGDSDGSYIGSFTWPTNRNDHRQQQQGWQRRSGGRHRTGSAVARFTAVWRPLWDARISRSDRRCVRDALNDSANVGRVPKDLLCSAFLRLATRGGLRKRPALCTTRHSSRPLRSRSGLR